MKIFILTIVIAIICLIIKNYKPEYGLLCQLCGVLIIGGYIVSSFGAIFDSVSEMFSTTGMDSSFLQVLLKALVISIMTDFASSICRDSANNTLSNAIELFGKTIIVFMALPMLKKLAETAMGFIK